MIPEEYHAASNFHTEAVTSDIERSFYEKADVLICQDEKEKDHFIEKYGKRDMEYIILVMEKFLREILVKIILKAKEL